MSLRSVGIALVILLGAAGIPSSAGASGGAYNVVKCHPWHLEADEVQSAGGHPSYAVVNECNRSAPDPKIGLSNIGAAGNNAYSQLMFTAPAGTHLSRVCLDYRLRRDNHHRADLLTYPGFRVLATGGDGPDGWTNGCFDMSESQVIVRLACAQTGGCPEGPNAHAYVRNLVMVVADDADPQITAFGGDVLQSGWLRGTKTLTADASDYGSGMFQLVAYVNGAEVGRRAGACSTGGLAWNFSPFPRPCRGCGCHRCSRSTHRAAVRRWRQRSARNSARLRRQLRDTYSDRPR